MTACLLVGSRGVDLWAPRMWSVQPRLDPEALLEGGHPSGQLVQRGHPGSCPRSTAFGCVAFNASILARGTGQASSFGTAWYVPTPCCRPGDHSRRSALLTTADGLSALATFADQCHDTLMILMPENLGDTA